jgi:hypothetical protein
MSDPQPETEMRQQLIDVFSAAEYPVTEPFELIPVLPDGAATTFEAGDVTLGAMDIGMGYADYQEYPYQSVEALADDLMTGLRDDGIFN